MTRPTPARSKITDVSTTDVSTADVSTTDDEDPMTLAFARITSDRIDEQAVRAAVSSDTSGAVVVFHGVIRNHDAGRGVLKLEYKKHPDAEAFLRRCIAEEQARTGLRLAAWHRIGPLQVGDTALIAAAAAAHRSATFDAVERLVERIKHEVPIWKRQHFTDGTSAWVGL